MLLTQKLLVSFRAQRQPAFSGFQCSACHIRLFLAVPTQGTYMFMAPECLRPVEETKSYEGHDGRAADAWALGICAYVRTATHNQQRIKRLQK